MHRNSRRRDSSIFVFSFPEEGNSTALSTKNISSSFHSRIHNIYNLPVYPVHNVFLHFDHPFYFRFILRSASPAITQAQYRTTVLIAAMPRAIAMITVFIIWFLQSLRLISNCLVWTNSQIYNRKRIWRNTYRTPPHSFYD